MKKVLSIALVVVITLALIVGCAKPAVNEPAPAPVETNQEAAKYEDGIYFAQEDGFAGSSGWKYVVTIEVKDGKIIKAGWNGAHKNGGTDKKTRSASGEYGMKANGGAQAEWHEQAGLVEAYLLETQDPKAITYTNAEGNTDAISGASIHVKEFFTLAEKALANSPVGKGQYKDGAYHAEDKAFDEKSGWKNTVDLTIINGYIVAADWNGIHKDGGDDKDTQSADGRYGMKAYGGAKAEWHEQAALAEAYLLEKQDPTAIAYTNAEGNTDAISGASIKVKEFFTLAEEALASAK